MSCFRGFAERAKRLADDPLQEALIFLKLFEEFIQGEAERLPACVFASYTYESEQFDPSIHEYIRQGFDKWRAMYAEKFEAVLARYDPVMDVTARELSGMIVAIIEGGFILARSYRDPEFIAHQSKQFRQYLQLLFPNALTLPVALTVFCERRQITDYDALPVPAVIRWKLGCARDHELSGCASFWFLTPQYDHCAVRM